MIKDPMIKNLKHVLSMSRILHSYPGFCRLRMHTKGGSPVAFVEYQDVRYAAHAMATLQGSLLRSSDRGAIRIEYAKSKMAEVGFTNPWIEVGSFHCIIRILSFRSNVYLSLLSLIKRSIYCPYIYTISIRTIYRFFY